MDADWIKSTTGRRILVHWADPRPAWLWSHDGSTLLWRNAAAKLFRSKIKKHGLKLAPDPVPIRGQIARLIRLGTQDRPSLSRIQLLSGEKPISETCTCTPLVMPDGESALLIVAVDAIEPKLLDVTDGLDRVGEALLPAGSEYLVLDEKGNIAGGSAWSLEQFGSSHDNPHVPAGNESTAVDFGGLSMTVTRFAANAEGAQLLLFEPVTSGERTGNQPAEQAAPPSISENPNEPLLPLGLPPLPQADAVADATTASEDWVEPFRPADIGPGRTLSSLFDQLAEDAALYAPLSEKDDALLHQDTEQASEEPAQEPTPVEQPDAATSADDAAVLAAFFGDLETIAEGKFRTRQPEPELEWSEKPEPEPQPEPSEDAPKPTLFKVVGRGFAPIEQPVEDEGDTLPSEPAENAETVERVSRYNFDELSRILTDRVGGPAAAVASASVAAPAPISAPTDGRLVNLTGETFVLNRLPIGILVFRDQQVLFANRALLDLTAHESIEGLRSSGLPSIFPAADASDASVGPVTQVVRRDGALVPVTARLQSIAWQGRPALMLSASAAEIRIGHEAAVKAFAVMLADAREEGFVSTDRSGTITSVSGYGKIVLRRTDEELVGRPISVIMDAGEGKALKAFLERPARFAETTRPSLAAKGADSDTDILLFAEGQAGIVTGYFALARRKKVSTLVQQPSEDADADPALLARVSRGMRRPLNTIIGFADLIRTAAFGPLENQRYVEYAGDIKTAGQEIAALVDELDDYARLKDGRYTPRRADLDLGSLLESCVVRVRAQASTARVLVRSAISERLPRILADRASLGQAVLNLMASAIDQTPSGASVVLSAQTEDDGSIVINIRDSSEKGAELGDRFMVFRDGLGREGETLTPVRSSVGLALTRSLLAVNSCNLSVAPTGAAGTLFSMSIPAELIVKKLG
ncbi:MAG TPA: HAMP domain-containing sensor histidine kinase [Arsenicitalea sp.]|jgi:signal transduction histidine kinase|nr:HAMP domain-containing sensor histidine kinase [Arsenicitalea sp.]